ncbi:outer membrane beta-barrel protein [Flavobacterium sp.]|uniref:outer membrane beta-barrel protein n=1 Tax=Flavobacterium sp. TaxID=239 RepID=UPI001B5F0947|nr:outer membrane beta-barrel protein [Flavobacterium sp.]MBP6181089.1 outer membrane beta-barrel protein [Flavobacterium sp.]
MSKFHFFFIFLLSCFSANAQEEFILKGTVLDVTTQIPLESATVYFSSVKDSVVLEYATTDKNGLFKITTKKFEKPVFLKVSYMGFQSYVEEQKEITENKDFGKLYLLENVNALAGVVVKSEAPPIRVKKDTLEFNAPSFKIRPDANVETLLKQLPGFEVDNDGKITVNGKEVTQFLVNGKTFFDRDGAMALKNLPAEIINKVQVSDFKTKKEELSKQESTSDYSSINLTIDEKKNKGFFGKFLGGYGTDDRYEASMVMNFFNNKQKISVLASSNNINSSGFSMDEVFDSMGGGRNTRGGNSASGSGKGITQSNLAGFNYTDEWYKGFDASASYSFSNTVTENESKSKQTNFLPTGNFSTESESKSRDENTGNKANLEFEYKINPTTRITFIPKVNLSNSNSNSSAESFSRDEDEELLNESVSKSYRENKSTNFGNTINFNKSFQKKDRNFSFVFNNSNTNSGSDALTESKTIFYQDGQTDDERNQKSKNENTYDSYSADIEYTEPITDSIRVRFGSDFGWMKEMKDLKTFDFEDNSQSYSVLNESLSNYITSSQNSISPKVGITFEKNKFTVNLNSSTSIIDFDNHSLYLNKVTDLNKKYMLPYGRAQIRYKLDRSKFITLRYDYSNSLPSSNQLLAVKNLANPLNTITGNPNLNPNEKHNVNINFRNFDFRTRSGYSLFLRGDYNNSEVVSISVYDASRKRTTTYENISGTYSTAIGGNWNQSIKREAHTLRYGVGLNGSYSLDKGFTNGVLYSAKSLGITPRVYLNYDYGEVLTIVPSYSLSYNESKYSNYVTNGSSNVVHRINLQTTSYWPKNWIFGNDFGYTYNSRIASGFKKDFYLWNTSLSYSFFNKNMIAKVKVYDVLNQNQSFSRTISPTTIRDEENTILKRYAMFSLTYKIQDFSGMKKLPRSENRREGFRENMGENNREN